MRDFIHLLTIANESVRYFEDWRDLKIVVNKNLIRVVCTCFVCNKPYVIKEKKN